MCDSIWILCLLTQWLYLLHPLSTPFEISGGPFTISVLHKPYPFGTHFQIPEGPPFPNSTPITPLEILGGPCAFIALG
jgi:hypothetical protein